MRNLLNILAPRVMLPHETPSLKPTKLYKQDPRAFVAHLAKETLVRQRDSGMAGRGETEAGKQTACSQQQQLLTVRVALSDVYCCFCVGDQQ